MALATKSHNDTARRNHMINQSILAAASRVAERAGRRPTSSVVSLVQSPDSRAMDSDPKNDDLQEAVATAPSVASNDAEVP
jgi:hypothetical protein